MTIDELERMIWNLPNDNIVRIFGCLCIKRVLNIFGQEFPNNEYLRKVVENTHKFALGQISEEDLIIHNKKVMAILEEVSKILKLEKTNKVLAAKAITFAVALVSLPKGIKITPTLKFVTPKNTRLNPEVVWAIIFAIESARDAIGFMKSQEYGKGNYKAKKEEMSEQLKILLQVLRKHNGQE